MAGKPITINYSRENAESLFKEFLGFCEEMLSSETDTGLNVVGDDPVDSYKLSFWKNLIERFEHNLAAELRGEATYFVPTTGIYQTSLLVEAAEDHVPSELHIMLPDIARNDYRSAGRCLAFGLFTASGFHAARAVEAMLGAYHDGFCEPLGNEKPTMNDFLSGLEGLKKGEGQVVPAKKTLRTVREFKDLDRNPLMHPRAVLSETDARVHFDLAAAAIIAMAREMIDIGDRGKQELLQLEQRGAISLPASDNDENERQDEGERGVPAGRKAAARNAAAPARQARKRSRRR